MKNPEWMHTYNAKYNKALKDAEGNVVKGWVIPVKFRSEFIEALNKREGLKQMTVQSWVIAQPAVTLIAPIAPVSPKIKATFRSRVKQTVSSDEFTVTLDSIICTVAPFLKETYHERCVDDKLYLSSNNSTLLSTKVETYGEEWNVILWVETSSGAVAILEKATA